MSDVSTPDAKRLRAAIETCGLSLYAVAHAERGDFDAAAVKGSRGNTTVIYLWADVHAYGLPACLPCFFCFFSTSSASVEIKEQGYASS
jgi:hypothetical protein